jgi:hypothetical protein
VAERPELLSAFDRRDGLLRLTPSLLADEGLAAERVALWNGTALYPHPHLAPLRELVAELFALASEPDLSVSIAVHPFRATMPEAA